MVTVIPRPKYIMTFIDIPQELLFSVAEYGQAPSTLSPDYILQEVKSLCMSNIRFNWCSEFLIHYLRSINPLYPLMRDLMKYSHWPMYDDENFGIRVDTGISDLEPEEVREIICNITTRYGYDYTIDDDDDGLIIVSTPGVEEYQLYLTQFLVNPRSENTLEKDDPYWHWIDLSVERTQIQDEEGKSIGEVPLNEDYMYIIEHATPELVLKITQDHGDDIFKQVPTERDIVSVLVNRFNDVWDLGELLKWLRDRRELTIRTRDNEQKVMDICNIFIDNHVTGMLTTNNSTICKDEICGGNPEVIMNSLIEHFGDIESIRIIDGKVIISGDPQRLKHVHGILMDCANYIVRAHMIIDKRSTCRRW